MLVNIVDVKKYLRITNNDSALENQLTLLAEAADQVVKDYCDREFESASRTWYPPLHLLGTTKLVLPERPVTTVTTVALDANGYYGQATNAFPTSSELTGGQDYALKADNDDGSTSDSGILVKLPGLSSGVQDPLLVVPFWPKWDGGVKVVYTGGYSSSTVAVPAQLKLAVIMLTAKMWHQVRYNSEIGSPIESMSTQDFAYSVARDELKHLSSVRRMLSRFRTPPV